VVSADCYAGDGVQASTGGGKGACWGARDRVGAEGGSGEREDPWAAGMVGWARAGEGMRLKSTRDEVGWVDYFEVSCRAGGVEGEGVGGGEGIRAGRAEGGGGGGGRGVASCRGRRRGSVGGAWCSRGARVMLRERKGLAVAGGRRGSGGMESRALGAYGEGVMRWGGVGGIGRGGQRRGGGCYEGGVDAGLVVEKVGGGAGTVVGVAEGGVRRGAGGGGGGGVGVGRGVWVGGVAWWVVCRGGARGEGVETRVGAMVAGGDGKGSGVGVKTGRCGGW